MKRTKTRGGRQRGSGRKARETSGRRANTALALQMTGLNWTLVGTAAVLILAGFITLAAGSPVGSTTLAPILLVAGYVVLIPLGLIL